MEAMILFFSHLELEKTFKTVTESIQSPKNKPLHKSYNYCKKFKKYKRKIIKYVSTHAYKHTDINIYRYKKNKMKFKRRRRDSTYTQSWKPDSLDLQCGKRGRAPQIVLWPLHGCHAALISAHMHKIFKKCNKKIFLKSNTKINCMPRKMFSMHITDMISIFNISRTSFYKCPSKTN